MMKQALKRAFPATLPVLAGYMFLGIAYGVTMKESGFGFAWTALCSLIISSIRERTEDTAVGTS